LLNQPSSSCSSFTVSLRPSLWQFEPLLLGLFANLLLAKKRTESAKRGDSPLLAKRRKGKQGLQKFSYEREPYLLTDEKIALGTTPCNRRTELDSCIIWSHLTRYWLRQICSTDVSNVQRHWSRRHRFPWAKFDRHFLEGIPARLTRARFLIAAFPGRSWPLLLYGQGRRGGGC